MCSLLLVFLFPFHPFRTWILYNLFLGVLELASWSIVLLQDLDLSHHYFLYSLLAYSFHHGWAHQWSGLENGSLSECHLLGTFTQLPSRLVLQFLLVKNRNNCLICEFRQFKMQILLSTDKLCYAYRTFMAFILIDIRLLCLYFMFNAVWVLYLMFIADQNTTAFKEVAIIRHPRVGEYAFGFITSSVVLQVCTTLLLLRIYVNRSSSWLFNK